MLAADDSVGPVLQKVFEHLGDEEKEKSIGKYHLTIASDELDDLPSAELQLIWDSISKHDSENASELSDVSTKLRRRMAKRIQNLKKEVRQARGALKPKRAARRLGRGRGQGKGRGKGRGQAPPQPPSAPQAPPATPPPPSLGDGQPGPSSGPDPPRPSITSMFAASRGVRGLGWSPTSRAFCRLCSQKMDKGTARAEIIFETRKPPGYVHVGCLHILRHKHPDLVDASIAALRALVLTDSTVSIRRDCLAELGSTP